MHSLARSTMLGVALVLSGGGCGGGSGGGSSATATNGTPDDAAVRARMEQNGQTPGANDQVSWDYQSIDRAAPRSPSSNEQVMSNIPAGTTVYPIRVVATYHFNAHVTRMTRDFLFYRDQSGAWIGSSMPTAPADQPG